ncbi:MAG: hypothetical protein KC418_09430 [Anaerolineales bacterium]|nr:hypothetical protein [Anaerolineales bacterium]MCB8952492.1 hypothetical protein [Ardenticatenales bacterium]
MLFSLEIWMICDLRNRWNLLPRNQKRTWLNPHPHWRHCQENADWQPVGLSLDQKLMVVLQYCSTKRQYVSGKPLIVQGFCIKFGNIRLATFYAGADTQDIILATINTLSLARLSPLCRDKGATARSRDGLSGDMSDHHVWISPDSS